MSDCSAGSFTLDKAITPDGYDRCWFGHAQHFTVKGFEVKPVVSLRHGDQVEMIVRKVGVFNTCQCISDLRIEGWPVAIAFRCGRWRLHGFKVVGQFYSCLSVAGGTIPGFGAVCYKRKDVVKQLLRVHRAVPA
jgi:hypothetical protein